MFVEMSLLAASEGCSTKNKMGGNAGRCARARALEHGDRGHAKQYAGGYKRHKELCVHTFGRPLPHAQRRLKRR